MPGYQTIKHEHQSILPGENVLNAVAIALLKNQCFPGMEYLQQYCMNNVNTYEM